MKSLSLGDTVAFIAPSGCIKANALQKGIAYFEKLGLKVKVMPHVYDVCRYMAGTDAARAADFNNVFQNPEIKAVFCVRGGAGGTRILDLIDYDAVKKFPKPLFGLSDSTALQNALYAQAGNVSYTGFLPIYDFKNGEIDADVDLALKQVLFGQPQTLKGGKCLRPGKTQGVLVGGCLSVFNYLYGTRYMPDLNGKILLLEDVGEKTYRLDLMLCQLKQQPNFSKIKGFIFGTFSNCVEADDGDGTVEDIIDDFIKDLNIPVIGDFPYGHIPRRYLLPIGEEVYLDADQTYVKIK